jgi:hypothetical protein
MNLVSLSPKQASDVSGRRDSRLTIMMSWIDSAIERRTIDRFCDALKRTICMFARYGGQGHEKRVEMRSASLISIIDLIRMELP